MCNSADTLRNVTSATLLHTLPLFLEESGTHTLISASASVATPDLTYALLCDVIPFSTLYSLATAEKFKCENYFAACQASQMNTIVNLVRVTAVQSQTPPTFTTLSSLGPDTSGISQAPSVQQTSVDVKTNAVNNKMYHVLNKWTACMI